LDMVRPNRFICASMAVHHSLSGFPSIAVWITSHSASEIAIAPQSRERS